MAAVRTTRAALPMMLARGRGAIVSTSSVNAMLADPSVIDYSAAKAALRNFCKSLSKELGPHGIRVNTVSPGPVTTDLWLGADGVAAAVAARRGTDPSSVAAAAARDSVTGRFTHPDEVANLVAFLASDVAGNITGADVTIDGGLISHDVRACSCGRFRCSTSRGALTRRSAGAGCRRGPRARDRSSPRSGASRSR